MLPLPCRLAKAEGPKAHVHLLYILEIPRALPLNAPLPEEEAIAARVVGEAEAIVRRAGLTPITHVTRARDIAEEIILQAEKARREYSHSHLRAFHAVRRTGHGAHHAQRPGPRAVRGDFE